MKQFPPSFCLSDRPVDIHGRWMVVIVSSEKSMMLNLRRCKSSVHPAAIHDKRPIEHLDKKGQQFRLRLRQCTSKTHVGTAVQDVIEKEKTCILQNHRWDRKIFKHSWQIGWIPSRSFTMNFSLEIPECKENHPAKAPLCENTQDHPTLRKSCFRNHISIIRNEVRHKYT